MRQKTNNKNSTKVVNVSERLLCGQVPTGWKYENIFWEAVDCKLERANAAMPAGALDTSVTQVFLNAFDIDGDNVFSALADNYTARPYFNDKGYLVQDSSVSNYTSQFECPGDFVEYFTNMVKDTTLSGVIAQLVKDPTTQSVLMSDYNVCGFKMLQLELVKDSSIHAELVKDSSIHAELVKDSSIHAELVKDSSIHTELVKDSSIHRIRLEYLDVPGVKKIRVELEKETGEVVELVKDSSIHAELVKDSSIHAELVKDSSIHKELVKDSSIHKELVKDSSIPRVMSGFFAGDDLVRSILELVVRYFLVLLSDSEQAEDPSISFEAALVGEQFRLNIADAEMFSAQLFE